MNGLSVKHWSRPSSPSPPPTTTAERRRNVKFWFVATTKRIPQIYKVALQTPRIGDFERLKSLSQLVLI